MILGDFIHEYTLDNHEQLNKAAIEFFYALKEMNWKGPSDQISNRKGWQKNNVESLPQMTALSKAIFTEFEKFVVAELAPVKELSIYLGNMFVNINPPGAYHLPHIHDGHWTGVYYLSAPKDCGDLSIMKPHQCATQAEQTKWFANVRLEEDITPKAGTGYFFPTHLVHYVHENLSDEDRISVAYNIRITETRR